MSNLDIDALAEQVRAGNMSEVPDHLRGIAEQYRQSGAALQDAALPSTEGLEDRDASDIIEQQVSDTPELGDLGINRAMQLWTHSEDQRRQLAEKSTGVALTPFDVLDGAARYVADVPTDTLFGSVPAGTPFFINRPGLSWQDVQETALPVAAGIASAYGLAKAAPSLATASVFTLPGALVAAGLGTAENMIGGQLVDALTENHRSAGRMAFDGLVGGISGILGQGASEAVGALAKKALSTTVQKYWGKTTFDKLPNDLVDASTGELTEQAARKLAAAGVDPAHIGRDVVDEMLRDPKLRILDPEGALAAADAAAIGAPATKAGVTGDPTDYLKLNELSSQANAPMREYLTEGTNAVERYGRQIADLPTGAKPDVMTITQDAGAAVREAMGAGKKQERTSIRALFDSAERFAPDGAGHVLPTSKIEAAFKESFDPKKYGARLQFAAQKKQMERAMLANGISNPDQSVPFNVSNASAFLENIQHVMEADPTIAGSLKPLKQSVLDTLTDSMESLSKKARVTSPEYAAGQQAQGYMNARAAYSDFMGKWEKATVVRDIMEQRGPGDALPVIRDSDVVSKLRNTSKDDVRYMMVVLTDLANNPDPAIASKAMAAKDQLRTATLLEGIEQAVMTSPKTGQKYLDADALNAYFDGFDTNALSAILTTKQQQGLASIRRYVSRHHLGELNRNTGLTNPVDHADMAKKHMNNLISHSWLMMHSPIAWAGVLTGKTTLAEGSARALGKQTTEALGGVETATAFRNLNKAQQKKLMDTIAATYPNAAALLSAGEGAKSAAQRAGRVVAAEGAADTEFKTE